jgi:hypothetical protein
VVEDLLDTAQSETVYNFRVADYHTYYVGSPDWSFSVWAHNACLRPVPRPGMTSKQRTVGRYTVTVWGTAQNTTGTALDPHAAEIMRRVDQYIRKQGKDIAYMTLNRSMRTASGRVGTSGTRSDITIVYRNDRVRVFEVGSPGQDAQYLQEQVNSAILSLPRRYRGSRVNSYVEHGEY